MGDHFLKDFVDNIFNDFIFTLQNEREYALMFNFGKQISCFNKIKIKIYFFSEQNVIFFNFFKSLFVIYFYYVHM